MKLLLGDCLVKLKELPDNSIDSVVSDPPYGLSFMGKKWDYDVPSVEIWKKVFRVLKPGGHLLSFAGTRTQHRMAVNIEDAGFEIRDMIAWVYGSGFPKSLNIGKKIEGWEGWGTALKPALEPITVARKPIQGTVAQNVLKWGTGGINIDESRVEARDGVPLFKKRNDLDGSSFKGGANRTGEIDNTTGRFPANFIHDGSDEVVELFPESNSGNGKQNTYEKYGGQWGKGKQIRNADFGDSGSAARFFYVAKASKSERGDGNNHPTVKPVKLMQYLVKLVTPPNGVVLDPFMGSGTTGIACKIEGFDFIGVEMDEEYMKIAEARINNWKVQEQQSLV